MNGRIAPVAICRSHFAISRWSDRRSAPRLAALGSCRLRGAVRARPQSWVIVLMACWCLLGDVSRLASSDATVAAPSVVRKPIAPGDEVRVDCRRSFCSSQERRVGPCCRRAQVSRALAVFGDRGCWWLGRVSRRGFCILVATVWDCWKYASAAGGPAHWDWIAVRFDWSSEVALLEGLRVRLPRLGPCCSSASGFAGPARSCTSVLVVPSCCSSVVIFSPSLCLRRADVFGRCPSSKP